MTKILKLLILFLAFCYFLGFSHVLAHDAKSVIINELFWSGSFVSTSDEFIELRNNTAENINLSGWQMTRFNSKGEEELMLIIPSGIIPSGGYFLISNSEKDHQYSGGESILNVDPDLIDSDLTLGNDHLEIKLYDGNWQDERTPIDIAGDGGIPLAGSNDTKSSMERLNLIGDGALPENWHDATGQFNLDFNRAELATPMSSGKPMIENAFSDPETIYLGKDDKPITFHAQVFDPDGLADIACVQIDLSTIGQCTCDMHDDGASGDETAGDGIYTYQFDKLTDTNAGEKSFNVVVKDKKNLMDQENIKIKIYQLSEDVSINEVLPRPSDDYQNEFIELYNKSSSDVDLYGWQIDDIENGGSSPYKIMENIIIPQNSFAVFNKAKTKIALNDTGDVVRLINPEGKEISITPYYGEALKGCSYNRFGSEWLWSTISTPGVENIILKPPEDLAGFILNLDRIIETRNVPVGTEITVVGVVINLPENFAAQYFYIEDETAGVQIYCYKKDFPFLNIGDKVKVTGELVHNSSGYRIKISSRYDIEIIEKNQIIFPKYIETGSVGAEYEGMLVSTRGKVVKSSGTTFYIDDGSGIVKVVVKKSTGINQPKIKKGMILKITGIAVPYKNEYQIAPRFDSDIRIISSGNVTKKSPLINKIITTAHAASSEDDNPEAEKAKNIASGELLSKAALINILEIIIIISSALFLFIIGEKYVNQFPEQASNSK